MTSLVSRVSRVSGSSHVVTPSLAVRTLLRKHSSYSSSSVSSSWPSVPSATSRRSISLLFPLSPLSPALSPTPSSRTTRSHPRWMSHYLRAPHSHAHLPPNLAPPMANVRANLPFPYITEVTSGGWRTSDIFSKLLQERIVCLNEAIDDTTSASIVAQLLWLESDQPEKPITMYINSPGGSVTAGLAIYDTMAYISSPVSTVCVGAASSMGALLLVGGARGRRYALPHSSVMVHQPLGGTQGQATDILIYASQMQRVRDQLNEIYRHHVNQALADRHAQTQSKSPAERTKTDGSTEKTETTEGKSDGKLVDKIHLPEAPSSLSSSSPSAPSSSTTVSSPASVPVSTPGGSVSPSDPSGVSEPPITGGPTLLTRGDVERLMDRDNYMLAEEALEAGIIDAILRKRTL